MKIGAIVFDGDGVIADLVEVHYQAFNKALETCGHQPISRQDQETKFNGLPTRVKLKILGITDQSEVERVNAKKQEITKVMIREHLKPDGRLVAVLQQLKDRGYQLAMASNSVRGSVHDMAYCTGALPFFKFMLSNEDVKNPKPHPEIYTKACELLGLQPYEVLVVEDNVNGQRAALEAGCRLCVVRDPQDVTASRILEAIAEHEALGYLLPTPQARNAWPKDSSDRERT